MQHYDTNGDGKLSQTEASELQVTSYKFTKLYKLQVYKITSYC